MPYHLYIHTPPHDNSDYSAHLIEHCAMGKMTDETQYFAQRKSEADCYTYYTHYHVDASTEEDLDAFCNQLCETIPESLIRYEAKVLRKEFESQKYFQSLISRIGKKLYGKNFSYSASKKLDIAAVRKYHAGHYQKPKIIVLERDMIQKDIDITGFRYQSSLSIRLRGEREFIVVGPYTPESFFVNELLQDLLDEYITYHTRYMLGEYFSNDTLAGEFEEHVFLSIDRRNVNFLMEIPPEFIIAFTKYALENFNTEIQHEIDGPLMIKYGYTLSNASKKALIEHLSEYYKYLQSDWLKSAA